MKGKGATRLKQTRKGDGFSLAMVKPLSIAVTVSSLMFAVVLLVLQLANKDVNQLEIVANFKYMSESDIEKTLQGEFPNGYISLDVQKIHQKLIEMPMVAEAIVEKIWPSTLKISVQEEKPVATWNDASLLSQAGDILPITFKHMNLPNLKGSKQDSRMVMQHYLLFNRWSKRHNLSLVGITKSTSGWLLEDKNGLKIWLDGANAMLGLKQLERVIDQFQLAKINSIDLRYEQGFAVAWKDEPKSMQG